ncbi:MAG TPA: caspase family protein [Thermotogota bacterium]|nr:caspase family protein [Thermotogota bacterium]HRW93942.1 caspase family protein [Thermotogota bacterium]
MKKLVLVFFLVFVLFVSSSLFSNTLHEQNSSLLQKITVVPDQIPAFTLDISSDRGQWGQYFNGDRISFRISASANVSVAVVGIDVNGRLSLLLPNDYDAANTLSANRVVSLPRGGYHYEVNTPGPGTEHVMVVGSRYRADLVDSLVSDIQSGRVYDAVSLGNTLERLANSARGDWAQAITSYYCNANAALPPQPGMVVLAMGISNYSSSGGLSYLPSPADDARDFAELMQQKYNVPSSNVKVLVDTQVTKRGIVSGFQWAESLAAGKDVVIFFSGHGGQLEDVNGDEDDGLDEVICPYDFSMSDKHGTALIDDEIAGYVSSLAARAKTVTFIFDSCFSGSAQKALPQSATGTRRKGFGMGTIESGGKAVDISSLRNFAFLAAAKGNETAQDFNAHFGHSLYTYFLLEGLEGAADANGDGQIGTREIHEYVYREIGVISQSAGSYFQTPVLDPSVDFIIWK